MSNKIAPPKNLQELSERLELVFPHYVEILDDGSDENQLVIYTSMKVVPTEDDPEHLEVF